MHPLFDFSFRVKDVVKAAVFLVAALLSGPVAATTCAITFSTLAEGYANAESVAVMQVNGCADGAISQMGRCPDERYELAVVELLKDSVPSRDPAGTYTGGDPMGCDVPLTIGNTYLLFIAGEGTLDHSASVVLNGESPLGRRAREKLRILRDYRDRKIDDLSDPWFFTDDGLYCSLTQDVGGRSLTFLYWYHEGDTPEFTQAAELDSDGNKRYRWKSLENPGLELEDVTQNGPQYHRGAVFFKVDLGKKTATVDDSASITIGNASWPLRTSRIELRMPSLIAPHPIVFEGTGGDAATEILEAMRKAPTDIVVSARRSFSPGDEWPTEENRYVTINTRSTQIADGAERFKACVDGTGRVPMTESP